MAEAIELTDDGLIRRMIAGDEDAFSLLYRRRHPSIYRFALHMSGNTAVAEDVTQEVFMALIRDTKRFDPARGTVGGFLYGIARNHLRKRWEQDRRLVPLIDENDPPSSNGNGHYRANGASGNGFHADGGAQAQGNGSGHHTIPSAATNSLLLRRLGGCGRRLAHCRKIIVR